MSARTLVLDVPDWLGHLAGQHVDVRLTAEDGYSTNGRTRSPSEPSAVELMVQRVPAARYRHTSATSPRWGTSSNCAARSAVTSSGRLTDAEPVLLVGRRVRNRSVDGDDPYPRRCAQPRAVPARVLGARPVGHDLRRRAGPPGPRRPGLDVTYVYTRETPPGWSRPAGRLTGTVLAEAGWPAEFEPRLLRLRADGVRRVGGEPARGSRPRAAKESRPNASGRPAEETTWQTPQSMWTATSWPDAARAVRRRRDRRQRSLRALRLRGSRGDAAGVAARSGFGGAMLKLR